MCVFFSVFFWHANLYKDQGDTNLQDEERCVFGEDNKIYLRIFYRKCLDNFPPKIENDAKGQLAQE